MNWVATLTNLQRQKVPAVMVTVVSISGSTPREAGAKMIVTEQQLFGTIGGGNLEHQATAIAREQLLVNQPQLMRRFPLGAGLGQCCGGLVNLLFEPIVEATNWVAQVKALQLENQNWVRAVAVDDDQDCFVLTERSIKSLSFAHKSSPELMRIADTMLVDHKESIQLHDGCILEIIKKPDFELLLFGAGHVGKAIVKIMAEMPVRIKWIDSRDDQFPANISDNVEVICSDTPEAEVDNAAAESFFLVMTHDHGLDQSLAEQILKRDDFSYFGLIGSKTKRRMFEKRMARRGIAPARFDAMTCPIGIDGIRSKQPATIAISVAAQLMRLYDQLADQPSSVGAQQVTLIGNAT